jgi:hypothetical protein
LIAHIGAGAQGRRNRNYRGHNRRGAEGVELRYRHDGLHSPLAIVSDNRTIARPCGWHSQRRLVIVTNVIRITPAALKAI